MNSVLDWPSIWHARRTSNNICSVALWRLFRTEKNLAPPTTNIRVGSASLKKYKMKMCDADTDFQSLLSMSNTLHPQVVVHSCTWRSRVRSRALEGFSVVPYPGSI